MQWSNSAGTKAGDTKIFYKNSGDYRLLEADGNGGYVEIARGTYKKVSEIHGRLFGENDRSIRGNTKEFRIQQGRSNGNRSVRGRKRTDDDGNSGQTGGKTVQGDNTGSDEHNRSGDRRDSVNNQFSLRSYTDSEYLKAVKSGDTETALLWILQRKRVIKKKFAETSPWNKSLAQTVKKPSDTPEAAVGQTSVNSISKYNRIVKH